MNLPVFIAGRYLFAKKSTQAINLISFISGLGIFVGTAALIIILSVFNGFEKIAISMFSSFSSDLILIPRQGKFFDPDSSRFLKLEKRPEIRYSVKMLEEKVLLKQNNSQYIASLRGLDSNFVKTHSLDSLLTFGNMVLEDKNMDFCILGSGVQARLSAGSQSAEMISVYAPRKNNDSGNEISAEDFNRMEFYPSGAFSAGEDFDDHLVLTSLRFMRKLIGEPQKVSAIQLYLQPGVDQDQFERKVKEWMGPSYFVKNRFEQNEVQFKTLNSEKWAVYLMLTFALVIVVFNIMGSLTMLVLEKKTDISVLSSLGASYGTIQSIFLLEGMIISLFGTLLGMGAGLLFDFLQMKYGFIGIGDSHSFAMSSYPIVIKPLDFLYVFLTVFSISFFASFLASRQSRQDALTLKEQLTLH
jgi:lipoprotein-releasing system permease protein